MTKCYQKKTKLVIHGRRTKWAPFWTVIRRYGKGKKVHASQMTRVRRSWHGTKLKLKPRRVHKEYVG